VLLIPEHVGLHPCRSGKTPLPENYLNSFDDSVQEVRSIRKVLEEGIPMISHVPKPTKAGDGCQALFTFFLPL
jgi:hypothetical protein